MLCFKKKKRKKIPCIPISQFHKMLGFQRKGENLKNPKLLLREKCPNLVRIFPHSDWIWKDAPYLSVFSPNAGKFGLEKLRIRTLFTQCVLHDFFQWICPSEQEHQSQVFNPLSAIVALIQKPVNWFAVQVNWLVSTWGQHWHLKG